MAEGNEKVHELIRLYSFEKNRNTVDGRVVELERLVMLYFSTMQKASWGPYGPRTMVKAGNRGPLAPLI